MFLFEKKNKCFTTASPCLPPHRSLAFPRPGSVCGAVQGTQHPPGSRIPEGTPEPHPMTIRKRLDLGGPLIFEMKHRGFMMFHGSFKAVCGGSMGFKRIWFGFKGMFVVNTMKFG